MSGDLEHFLRQAAQRKSIQSPPREVVEILDDDVEIIEAQVLSPQTLSPQTLSPQTLSQSNSGSGPHRLGNIGTDRIVDEVAELDHRLGNLESTPTTTDDVLEEAALKKPKLDLKKMISGTAIINSVIVSEILKRPEW
ncbi:MAG: hypothetical protein ACI9G1_003053 [Pirellulaceae bacterium]|jgi:uncharacterized protein YdcH (DUF465 family)